MELTKKKIETSESISLQLKNARLAQGLSCEDVALQLKMSKEHIADIENGDFDKLPFAPIYQKKLIGNFAEIVGIQKNVITKQFEMEQEKIHRQNFSFTKKHRRDWWYNVPLLFRVGGIASLALILFGYLGFQVKQIITPPTLQVFAPIDGVVAKTETIEVKGKTDKEVKVTINGNEITHDDQGGFQAPLALTQGVNTIVISATTKHGKSKTMTFYVVAQKEQQFSLVNSLKTSN